MELGHSKINNIIFLNYIRETASLHFVHGRGILATSLQVPPPSSGVSGLSKMRGTLSSIFIILCHSFCVFCQTCSNSTTCTPRIAGFSGEFSNSVVTCSPSNVCVCNDCFVSDDASGLCVLREGCWQITNLGQFSGCQRVATLLDRISGVFYLIGGIFIALPLCVTVFILLPLYICFCKEKEITSKRRRTLHALFGIGHVVFISAGVALVM